MSDLADAAVTYILRRIKSDPRLAYYFGHTESLSLLAKAHAVRHGHDPEIFLQDFNASLKSEPPVCRQCREETR